MDNPFVKLAAINVNEHVEKKNNLSYLSWAWAVDQLMRQDPKATWEFGEPVAFGETLMVRCTVTAFDKAMTCHLPVMDHRNKAIPHPDAFQVNTAMQRCLVKAIALHGLGLYIYAGEDLPEGEEPKRVAGEIPGKGTAVITPTGGAFESLDVDMQNWCLDLADRVSRLFAKGDIPGAWDELTAQDQDLDVEVKAAVWSKLDSKCRAALKKEADGRKQRRGATPDERAAA